jgi:hypothetical protein
MLHLKEPIVCFVNLRRRCSWGGGILHCGVFTGAHDGVMAQSSNWLPAMTYHDAVAHSSTWHDYEE